MADFVLCFETGQKFSYKPYFQEQWFLSTAPMFCDHKMLEKYLYNPQIKQAKGYIFKHLKPSILDEHQLEFVVELRSTHKDLVRVRFASRHSNSKNYIATVQFDNDDDDEPIKGWFCTYSARTRVIGCCAHIAALI